MRVCALVNAQHEHVCVSVYLAFVTKHPRCQRDTVGCRREGGGTGGVSALLCACSNCRSAFQTLALGEIYSRPGGERIQRALFTREQGLRGGVSTCSPYVPEADDCWEVTRKEDGEGEGWRDPCTLGLCSQLIAEAEQPLRLTVSPPVALDTI